MEERSTLFFVYTGIFSVLLTLLLCIYPTRAIVQQSQRYDLVQDAEQWSDIYNNVSEEEFSKLAQQSVIRVCHLSEKGVYLTGSQSSSDFPLDISSYKASSKLEESVWIAQAFGPTASSLIELDDGTYLYVEAAKPTFWSVSSRNLGYLLAVMLLALPAIIILAIFLAQRIVKPVRQIGQQVKRLDFSPDESTTYPELMPILQELSDRRDERERMRQEFTANVSHELKTPLTTISGYSEMIANGIVRPEDIERVANKIHSESTRMQSLVADIIELNALDSQEAGVDFEPVNLFSIVQDCIEQLSPSIQERKLNVSLLGSGFTVNGNRRQLWELTYNLIDNARRYNVDGGRIQVTVDNYVLSVKDTGMGIPAEHQARIFERFYRVDKSHSRASGGTGLGLSIVKHVAELHHAVIELDSTEHIGTEIRVRFPK